MIGDPDEILLPLMGTLDKAFSYMDAVGSYRPTGSGYVEEAVPASSAGFNLGLNQTAHKDSLFTLNSSGNTVDQLAHSGVPKDQPFFGGNSGSGQGNAFQNRMSTIDRPDRPQFTEGKYSKEATLGQNIAGYASATGAVVNMLGMANKYAAQANNIRNQITANRYTYQSNWRAEATNQMNLRERESMYMASQRASLAGSGVASTSGSVKAVVSATSSAFETNIQQKAVKARNELQQGMYNEELLTFQLKQAKKNRLGAQVGAVMGLAGAVIGGVAGGGGVGASIGSQAGTSIGRFII